MAEMTENEAKDALKQCEADIMALYDDMAAYKVPSDMAMASGSSGAGSTKFRNRKLGATPENKVSDCSWYTDSRHLACAQQDGKIIIYDAQVSKSPLRYYLSQKTWLMTVEFSPDGKRLAAGGLDNNITIHNIPDLNGEEKYDPVPDMKANPGKSLQKHAGYIGTCKWLDDQYILSASGSKDIMLWDTNLPQGVQKEPLMTFNGHEMDVCSVTTSTASTDTFLTGSSDKFAKMWDKRLNCDDNFGAVISFQGHEGGITDVNFLPGGNAFVSSSEDGTMRLWDIRAMQQVQVYEAEDTDCRSNCVSQSGAYVIGGYITGKLNVFNTITGDCVQSSLKYHNEDEISSIELSPDGKVLCSTARGMENNISLWC